MITLHSLLNLDHTRTVEEQKFTIKLYLREEQSPQQLISSREFLIHREFTVLVMANQNH